MKLLSSVIAISALCAASLPALAFELPFNITIRDFRGAGAATNLDFDNDNISGLRTGLVASTLDANGKPVYVGSGGDTDASGSINSKDSFSKWYSGCNGGIDGSCIGQYNVTLTATVDPATDVLSYISNAFFPLDSLTNSSIWDSGGNGHNFFFTSELNLKLIYDPTKENLFKFSGDDDVWVFINGQLVMDLGGIHARVPGQFDLDTLASGLGIDPYEEYIFSMFHAERHHTESNLEITSTLGQPLNNVPEPGVIALMGIGLLGLAANRRKAAVRT